MLVLGAVALGAGYWYYIGRPARDQERNKMSNKFEGHVDEAAAKVQHGADRVQSKVDSAANSVRDKASGKH
jgi:hypothetical protein